MRWGGWFWRDAAFSTKDARAKEILHRPRKSSSKAFIRRIHSNTILQRRRLPRLVRKNSIAVPCPVMTRSGSSSGLGACGLSQSAIFFPSHRSTRRDAPHMDKPRNSLSSSSRSECESGTVRVRDGLFGNSNGAYARPADSKAGSFAAPICKRSPSAELPTRRPVSYSIFTLTAAAFQVKSKTGG